MPHRKLVRIGEPVTLPTIAQFLTEMASRQNEEIQRLKREALSGTLPDPTVADEHHEELTPDPWQLHPVRLKKSRKKVVKKASRKTAARKVKPRKLAKKAAKRTKPKPTARKKSRTR